MNLKYVALTHTDLDGALGHGRETVALHQIREWSYLATQGWLDCQLGRK